ncbi:unnamed protein product [Parnassius mnemosyne]|uniref:Uncharacterized protein n=1 Tax=Parnassius mnemosyne TaxID=213953 RepID=A0AAV1M794_9NEOP
MDAQKQHIQSMIFDYATTTNTDFRKHHIRPTVKSNYKDKNLSRKKRKSPVKYVHTMTDWKNVSMPFDLWIEQKQIVRTNPHHVQEPYEKPPDLEIDKIRMTRPRLVMTPAVSIDDVEDLEKRKLLLQDMYTTNVTKEFGMKCALSTVRSPLRGKYAPANPIPLPKLTPPYVSPEWRMQSTSWDRQQTRAYCDATRVFWLNRNR